MQPWTLLPPDQGPAPGPAASGAVFPVPLEDDRSYCVRAAARERPLLKRRTAVTAKTLPLDGPAFEREVVNNPGLTLVDFWAAWCSPCRALLPSLERLATSFAGRAKVAKVEVDANPDLAQRFGVRSIPTLVFFRDGREVDRIVGNLPYPTLEERLARLTG